MGAVLTPAGGALAAMLPIFKLGGGGRFGSGLQPMSWVSIDDVVGAFHHALQNGNAVGAGQRDRAASGDERRVHRDARARAVAARRFCRRPRSRCGWRSAKMADVLLNGSRVIPERLMTSGYEFRHPELEAALRHVLGEITAPRERLAPLRGEG